MLTQEEIQKIQYLLTVVQNKKDSLIQQKQNIEVDLKITEQQLNEIKKFFEEELEIKDISKIEERIVKIENEIKEWINKTEEVLNEI